MLIGLGAIGGMVRGKKAEMRLHRVKAKINGSETNEIAGSARSSVCKGRVKNQINLMH
jgi:hypothetical protein